LLWSSPHGGEPLAPTLSCAVRTFLQCGVSTRRLAPSSFNTILSSAWVYSTSPPVSVWGTVYTAGLFPGTGPQHVQSDKDIHAFRSVTSARPTIINVVPIDYAFRPRLRGRLTLRGLTLRRNPWTFGDSVSHTVCRYSCQHSHFRYLQAASRTPFAGLRNAPLPRDQRSHPQLRYTAWAPIHFRRRPA